VIPLPVALGGTSLLAWRLDERKYASTLGSKVSISHRYEHGATLITRTRIYKQ